MSGDADATKGAYQFLTGPGPAAIAVLRARGPQTGTFVARHIRLRHSPAEIAWQAGQVWRAELLDADGAPLDDILVSVHATPPDWDLRLHLHANPWLVRRCAELLGACGLSATAEEQTTLWPTTDALEAEAWALLPRMLTLRGARWLLGQVPRLRAAVSALLESASPEAAARSCAEIAGRTHVMDWFARPLRIVLAGPPNVGKSTLANALADRPVSLVSATPGTTRDWVEVPAEAAGFPVVWLDTAGVRAGSAGLEAAGVERTRRLIQEADAVLIVLDIADVTQENPQRFLETYTGPDPACVALNKSDLGGSPEVLREALPARWQERTVAISAARRAGLDALCETALANIGRATKTLDRPATFTPRQTRLLQAAAVARDVETQRGKLLQFLGTAEVT